MTKASMTLTGEKSCKTALCKTGIPGYRYCLNPYVGCAHGCIYCYASFMSRFAGRSKPWGKYVDAKVNFAAVLEKQLKGGRLPGGRIIMGTVTDLYQPAETGYELTRSSLEVLARYPSWEVDILTKSSLVVRDISLIQKLSRCSVGFTVTTVDEKISRILEPGAPPPAARLAAARQLVRAGIPVWVFIAPLLPGLGDTPSALSDLFSAVAGAGVKEVWVDRLNPYPTAVGRLKKAYQLHFPTALTALEAYLSHPANYLGGLWGRLIEISGSFGCQLSRC